VRGLPEERILATGIIVYYLSAGYGGLICGDGMRLVDEIMPIMKSVKEYLINRYGEGIKRVVVYGSFARGEAAEESDVDVVVVIDDKLDPFDVEEYLSEFLFDILLERGELVSVFAIRETVFKKYNSPFLMNVREEGKEV
jgi:predicted nucleotidyltransferase